MAEYPTYTAVKLSEVSGNPESEYGAFAAQALKQATLLFKIGTCLKEFPDDAHDAEIAEQAILQMADAIYWAQPWQKVLRNPFSSETIGSYSYSKLTSAVSAGIPTGVTWFDIAVGTIGICDLSNGPMHGGWLVHEENKEPAGGYGVFVGPAEKHNPDYIGSDSFDPPERG